MRRRSHEDEGSDGIATGTQKRGSKQGEALTSACFTLERKQFGNREIMRQVVKGR